MSDTHDLIIIGSGPAGYSAAVYAARADLRPLVFEGSVSAGGALMTTTDVENFPGFPDAITGPELMERLRRQAEHLGARLVPEDVVEVDLTGPVKTVVGSDGTEHRGRAVILATGSARWRPVEQDIPRREDPLVASENVRVVTDDNFDEVVLRSEKPVLLDFWAEWCGPCRLMLPVLDEIARENETRITIATLNVEENPRRVAEFNVTSMPTLQLYTEGRLVHTLHGARPKSKLMGELANLLAWS